MASCTGGVSGGDADLPCWNRRLAGMVAHLLLPDYKANFLMCCYFNFNSYDIYVCLLLYKVKKKWIQVCWWVWLEVCGVSKGGSCNWLVVG